jgi:hypothetical protein
VGANVDAIYVIGGITDFTICGNHIYDDRATPIMRAGVYVNSGASDRYVITGNLISGATLASIYDVGTGTNKTIANNQGNNDLSLTKNLPIATGGKFLLTGNISNVTSIAIDAAATGWRGLTYSTSGASRWIFQIPGGMTESGSNVGSDFSLYAMADNGTTVVAQPLSFTRSTGLTTVGAGLRVNGNLGFGVTPIAKPTVAGAWAGNTAGKALSTALAAMGLITDSTTA